MANELKERIEELLRLVEKPGRYIGRETNVSVKEAGKTNVRFGFAFPDLYEIGMSYMGMQILYNTINKREGISCERIFTPAHDMEMLMRERHIPLFTLENKTDVKEMDIIGFTLQYEMAFTNILNMLDMAGMPLRSIDRDDRFPLVAAGGPCAFNPEPLAPFIDFFIIGDGENTLPVILEKYGEFKARNKGNKLANGTSHKIEFLKEIQSDPELAVYVPGFYEEEYDEFGNVSAYKKLYDGAPDTIQRAIIDDIDTVEFPENPVVPLIETVHDRSVVETFRGCTRGCRFCQAGMIYRPIRERSKDNILRIAEEQIKNTGHDELSILSLSTSDYSDFENLALELMGKCKANNVSLSLPSLRLDSFSFKVLDEIQGYKKSGLTFAPEAGSQRLRDVINKGITENDIYDSVRQAIGLGWKNVKLYFMIGLPTETLEDLDGIAEIARNIVQINKEIGNGGRFNVTVSVSNFVPKAHTPFQWSPQNSTAEFTEKHNYLFDKLKIKGVTFNYHDDYTSTIEAIFARGDRRVADLLENAFKLGCKLDGWSEFFNLEGWKKAIEQWDMDENYYTTRERSFDELLPWDKINSGVKKSFLLKEMKKALNETTTHDCRYGCVGCGINERVTCHFGGIYE
ncbi:MAG: TIGR03960 family B12-binding radical SAM protein [Peptostreptococcaceae bacterium]|nr:TIGR03960 family B12-binding radical SAM protein [Peptostreptococcaceae bacterium]MDY5739557.1 TIGR03960 family B12-binding radical SAM protein [Anaerovoracaceae bacterium]